MIYEREYKMICASHNIYLKFTETCQPSIHLSLNFYGSRTTMESLRKGQNEVSQAPIFMKKGFHFIHGI